MGDLSIGYRLTAELDVERVCSGHTWGVHEAYGTVAVVHNIDVDVGRVVAVDAARHVTVARLRCVHVDDAFLAHRDRSADSIYGGDINK